MEATGGLGVRAGVPVIHRIEPPFSQLRIRQGVLNTYGFHSAAQFERIHRALQNEAVGYSSGRECVLNVGIALQADETCVSTLDALDPLQIYEVSNLRALYNGPPARRRRIKSSDLGGC